MKLQGTMSKLLGHVFAQIDGVVWDLMSNQTGIKREDGIYTMKDGQIELNPFDAFAMELPAFSQLIPIDQVNAGDVLEFLRVDACRVSAEAGRSQAGS